MPGINSYISRNTDITMRSHKMTQLLEKLTEFFNVKEQSRLESFINSKRPTNAAEVEYWTREYENNSNGLFWGRGL